MKGINVVALVPFKYGSVQMTPPPSKDAARASAYELCLVPHVAAALCRSGQATPSMPHDSDALAKLTGERHAAFYQYAHDHSKAPEPAKEPEQAKEPKTEAESNVIDDLANAIADKPVSDYTKAELAAFLKGQGVEFPSDAKKDDLVQITEAWIAEGDAN